MSDDPNFDLTGDINFVALTKSETPFAMNDAAAKRFQKAAEDPMSLFRGRTLEATNVHMGLITFEREGTGIAGAAALVTPGLLAAGRVFVDVKDRENIMAANPKFAETPYIAAAETIAFKVYNEGGEATSKAGREATPEEKKAAATLMLMGIRHLAETAPGADKLLPKLVEFLKQRGYDLGENVPLSLRVTREQRAAADQNMAPK